LLKTGKFLEAETKAIEILNARPDLAPAWFYLGVANVRLDHATQAIQAFERAIALDSQDPRPFLDLALLYAAQNDLDKAIDRYQKGLSIGGGSGTAYYNYGRLLMKKGRSSEALDPIKRAIELMPHDIEVQTALVEALLRNRQREEALRPVKQILDTQGVPASALAPLGALLVRAGERALAKTVLTEALSISPGMLQVHLEFSRLYLAVNDYPKAIREAEKAIALAPASLEANLALAEALISGRQDRRALEQLEKMRARFEGTAGFQYTLGIVLSRLNQSQPAINAFQRAVQLDPSLDLAHYLLGNIFLGVGDLRQAENSLKAAISINPNSALYYNYLARVYELQGDSFKTMALETTNKVLALDPKDLESRERLAKWAKDEGDLPRARKLLEDIIADAPSFLPARVMLVTIYHRLKLGQEAEEQQKVIRQLEESQKKRAAPDHS
jgi:tetratricopeptide (TPR) repeat protein